MAITSGFYNSNSGDRKYSAEQFNTLFAGIITDGVFANYPAAGEQLVVSAVSGMQIKVGPGRGWFNNTWINNDSDAVYTCSAASESLPRIDSLFIKIDKRSAGRLNSIVLETGEAASSPVAPTKENTSEIFWYRLADISIPASATSVGTITNYVGTGIPVITAPLEHVSAAGVLDGWKQEVDTVVQTEVDLFLNNQNSVLSSLIKVIPAIWLCDRAVPETVGTVITFSRGPQTVSPVNFYPNFFNRSEVRNRNSPKSYDIVIGNNGYYGEIVTVFYMADNAGYSITVRSLGKTILSDVQNTVAEMMRVSPMVWLCDHDVPDTDGHSVSYSMDSQTTTSNRVYFYPDFYDYDDLHSRNTPKLHDVVLGSNGYYGEISYSNISDDAFTITIVGTGKSIVPVIPDSGDKILEIAFAGIDPYDTTVRYLSYPDVSMYPTWPAIREAYNDGYKLIAKILIAENQYHGTPSEEDIYAYVPITTWLWDGHLAGIEVHTLNYWVQSRNIDSISYSYTTNNDLVGSYERLYSASDVAALASQIPRSCSYNSETGTVAFLNGRGSTLFTFQLPVYTGTIEER